MHHCGESLRRFTRNGEVTMLIHVLAAYGAMSLPVGFVAGLFVATRRVRLDTIAKENRNA